MVLTHLGFLFLNQAMKTKKEIGSIRRDEIFTRSAKVALSVKLTPKRTFKAISDGLDAFEVRSSYDKDAQKWSYSKKLIDHKTRLNAAGLSVMVLGLKTPEKHESEIKLSHELSPELEELFEKMKK